MICRIKKGLLLLLMSFAVLTTSNIAVASPDSRAQAEGYMSSILNHPYDENDLAHKSLVRLFGGFIFEPFGEAPAGEPTALAKVLGYTNIIAMILGVIIMAYVILAGALNTAASGEMLGKSWSSVWLPLRTSLAFGMIMPASGGGETFSVAQSLVVWMIIVGSNSATWLWEKGADALITGSPVMPTTIYRPNGIERGYVDTIYCAAVRNHMTIARDEKADWVGTLHKSSPMASSPGQENTQAQRFKYDEVGSLDLKNAKLMKFDDCGEISIPNSYGVDITKNTSHDKGYFGDRRKDWEKPIQTAFYTSAQSHLNEVILASKAYADNVLANNIQGKKVESEIASGKGPESSELIMTLANDYANVGVVYGDYVNKVKAETIAAAQSQDQGSDWKARMVEGGWMRAGAWFFETSRLQGFIQTLLGGVSGSTKYYGDDEDFQFCWFGFSYSKCKEVNQEFKSWLSINGVIKAKSTETPSSKKAESSPGNMQMVDSKGFDAKAMDTVSSSIASLFLNTVMGIGADSGQGGGNVENPESGSKMSNNVSGMISPFTAVSSLGRGLQQIGATVWFGGLIASGFIGFRASKVGEAAATASWGVMDTFIGISKYVMASLAPVLLGVGALAFMLAFAIPFMPVTIWIMLVCGYLVTVIEAIAAAPLAVIMLATPEGEGISGTSFKHALQMVNAIILRPSLSIVGLFAAMTLSYAGFAILNDLFWSVAGLTTNISVFEVLALIFIYATLAFKVCEYMVSVIHKIPDQIMEWMGGGMSRPFGEDAAGSDMAGALKTNTAASGVSGMAGMKTAGGIVSDRQEKAKNKAMEAAMADKDKERNV